MPTGPESKFVSRLSSALVSLGCERRNMHGNLYQDGIPDNLVIRPGSFTFFEAKHIYVVNPTLLTLQSSLRPNQKKNIAQWSHVLGCQVFVVADWARDSDTFFCVEGRELPPVLCVAEPIPLEKYTLEEVATWIATGSLL